MVVYFLCSPSADPKFTKDFKKIFDVLSSLDYKVISGHFSLSKSAQADSVGKKGKDPYDKLLGRIRQADLVIAEVSGSGMSLGYELGLASDMNIPILVLYQEGTVDLGLLAEIDNPRFVVCSYSPSNIRDIVTLELESLVQERDIRFNFFISSQLADYLDWLSQKERTPRAVFLRKMLEKKMQFDEDYQKILKRSESL
ncbi:hypothetical protein COT52_01330 [candidate division WWE3 bacterium CG08_land_8_20_14_0_20_43_13]|uniref:Nucleoside 2-deoxyribosyltransferase n=1 Tax=candidate division WWE3 bacterium CG08_land_8_20_14_0_20_43_13 TaxID=1975087 RepID=A0A2H0X7L2_UNCKA|nr:MAG: hypothetical protein COT52_01330 [candidate division WWE3 bacterium CG08_land_8_20_14_0_20_43_13]